MKCTCSNGCGDLSLPIDSFTLRYRSDTKYEDAQYRFFCPKCKQIILKPCSKEVANILYTSGIKVERYDLPLELLERPNEIDAAPISDDDVIDLGLALQNDEEGWMNRMMWGKGSE